MLKKQLAKIYTSIAGMSLIKKFILAYLFIIAIPIAILGAYSFQSIKNATLSDAKKSDMHTVQQAQNHIIRNMEICKRSAQQAISNRDFLEFISVDREHTAMDYILFKRGPLYRFETILNINPDIYKMRFFVDNPYLEEIWPSIYRESRIGNKALLEKVKKLKGENVWVLNHPEEKISSISNEKLTEVVSLYRDVSYVDNIHIAVLEVNMEANVFFDDIYNMDTDESTMLCALLEKDKLIYNRNSRFLNRWGSSLNSIRNELLKNISGGSYSDFTFSLARNQFMVSSAYIKEIDSHIFKITSVDDLTKKLDRTRNVILFGIIGGMAVLGVVTYLITSVLLKKMKIIITSMRKVQAGCLCVEIPVEGRDEIGELAHHFKKMMEKINELITVVVHKQSAAKDAEIRALQTQINAHFIYNVLEAIKTVAENDYKYDISDYLTALGRMMRYSMQWTDVYVTLKQEIDHVKNYLSLMNLRCENKIDASISIRDEFLNMEILKMTLQPIVENAINHGLAPKNWEGKLEISAYKVGQCLYIQVMDDGIGMNAGQLEKLREEMQAGNGPDSETTHRGGIGLKNVHERIKLFYGDEYGLKIESKESEYTKVFIVLPFKKGLWG